MGSLTATPHRPEVLTAPARDHRPLACIASSGRGAARRRKDARLAAVLSEFGFRTHVADAEGDDGPVLDADRVGALADARLVVCDVVRPDLDLPVEAAIAATRGTPVIALVPDGVAVRGLARALLDECAATVLRYAGVEPHRVLHGRLLEQDAA